MSIKTPESNPLDFLNTEYFHFVNVDGRKFTVIATNQRYPFGENSIITPFSNEAERQLFLNFATVFLTQMQKASPMGKEVQKPQGIRQQIGRWMQRLLSLPKGYYRAFWQ